MPSKRDRKCRNFSKCGAFITRENTTGFCLPCFHVEQAAAKPGAQVEQDRERARAARELVLLRTKYAESLKQNEKLEQELRLVAGIKDQIETYEIKPMKIGGGSNEGVIVAAAHDWHIEERVRRAQVNGKNEYNLEISKARGEKFFRSTLRLTKLLQQDIAINNLILPLLGDFISNDIHEEFPEINQLQPIDAILEAQNRLATGINFLLNNSKLDLTIPCHSGNHARTTRTTRASSENGHSLEYFMYHSLAGYFRNEKRVKFLIAEGYHSYVNTFDLKMRLHHGHEIKYLGGVGGIYISVNKAIDKWNQIQWADLDVFGHHHQKRDGGNFVAGGSMIGFNAYALRGKFGYEPPSQTFFMVDKKRNQRLCNWPILF